MNVYVERLRKCGYGASRAFCVAREVFLNLGYIGLENFVWSVEHGETPEEYEKRIKKLRRLGIERDFLEDAIFMLDGDKREKKKARLDRVNRMIQELS